MTEKRETTHAHSPAEEAMEAAVEMTGSIFEGMMRLQDAMRHATDPMAPASDVQADSCDDEDDMFDNMPV